MKNSKIKNSEIINKPYLCLLYHLIRHTMQLYKADEDDSIIQHYYNAGHIISLGTIVLSCIDRIRGKISMV